MAKALPAWNETEAIDAGPAQSGFPRYEDTAAITPEIMPKGFEAPGKIESVLRGAGQGASLGYSDEVIGALEAMLTEKSYTQARDESRANNAAAKKENPLSYLGGQVGGGVLSAIAAPEMAAGKLGAVALKMGALGAAQGIGESDSDLMSVDTAKQAALSALIGGTLGAGGTAIANRFRPQALDELAESTGQRAVGFTKKLLKNDMQKAQAKAATRMALDSDIIKPFASVESMQEGAEGLAKSAGSKMGEFLEGQSSGATRALKKGAAPQLREQFLFDPQQSITELESLRPQGLNMGDNADINRVIDKAIDTVKAKGTMNARGEYALRPIPWEDARGLKSQIQGMANWDTAASNEVNNMKRKLGGRIRDSFMSQLEDSATARGGREGFDDFAKNVKSYQNAENLQDSLRNRYSSVAGNQPIGLKDAMMAAAEFSATGSPVKAATAGGAMKAIGRYGDQSISWSADRLSKAIQNSPQIFQKWLPNFKAAAARGPQGLAVTSFILQQSDPSYSDTLKQLSEDEGR